MPDDPRLGTYSWRLIREHWARVKRQDCEAPVCLLPGIPIRYTGQRGPDSLDVGHKQAAVHDTRTSWTIADTRPEHARCNRSAGVAIGKARAAARRGRAPAAPRRQGEQASTAYRW